jgi:hypothetical protein
MGAQRRKRPSLLVTTSWGRVRASSQRADILPSPYVNRDYLRSFMEFGNV